MTAQSLVGCSALVTGASQGIGHAIATTLAAAGARVFLVARAMPALELAAADIGNGAVAITCDLTDVDAVALMTTQVATACDGAPDILVNNAGLFPLIALDVMSPADFEHTLAVNLVAPFRVLRAFLPAMRAQRRGHLVTIGSVADRSVFAGNGAYAASKYGQRAMHEVLQQETRGSGVRSTLISPAATDTPIWDPMDPDNRPGFPSRASMLRAKDVGEAVLWAVTRGAGVNVDELRLSSG